MFKRYRYRAYPTPAQIAPINQVFGCTRVVFNDALALCKAEYEATGKKPSSAELSRRLRNVPGLLRCQQCPCNSPYVI